MLGCPLTTQASRPCVLTQPFVALRVDELIEATERIASALGNVLLCIFEADCGQCGFEIISDASRYVVGPVAKSGWYWQCTRPWVRTHLHYGFVQARPR